MINLSILYKAVGKRKTAVALVIFQKGTHKILINNTTAEFFLKKNTENLKRLKLPFLLVNLPEEYTISIYVKGGGINSQLNAIKLAIAKVLCKINFTYKAILNKNFLLKCDSRIKERRKYGLKKARKASQYSKR